MATPRHERPGTTELSTAECWSLLESHDLGRLAVIGVDGGPDIYPINYTVHEGVLYARSARGKKLLDVTAQPGVAFEIDGADEDSSWSVVVRGDASRVAEDAEIRASGVRELVSANPAVKPHVLRIRARSVSGRRLQKGVEPDFEDLATEVVVPETRRRPRKKSERPTPIPAMPPDDADASAH